MLFDRWCYKLSSDEKHYSVLSVSKPVTKRQAAFLLKKELKIQYSYLIDIVPCEEVKESDGEG